MNQSLKRLYSEVGMGAIGLALVLSGVIITAGLVLLIQQEISQRNFIKASHTAISELANKNAVVVTKKLVDANAWTSDATTGVWSTVLTDNSLWVKNTASTPKGSVFIKFCDPRQMTIGEVPVCNANQMSSSEVSFGNVTNGKLSITAKTSYSTGSSHGFVPTLTALIPVVPVVGMCGTWTATALTGAPTARFGAKSLWTGSKMIVWGGYDSVTHSTPGTNTGGLYDPVANSWAPTSVVNAPSARISPDLVWTGSKMIVWGGDAGIITNTGGLYDPVTNSWTATTLTGAPTVRRDHSVVWAGSKMIVWGGEYSSTFLNTGGVYDPWTNSWTATNTSGAPSGRHYHTAVWTGSKMIIWGGIDASTGPVAGGQYDPIANTWTATTTAGAPSGRMNHRAVWTGSKMIIWGGNFGGASNTGGLYDPILNSWVPTATTGAPSGRGLHSSVWTGSRMIVWGGNIGSNIPTDSGGLYDPESNTWLTTSTAAAPTPRFHSPAVWTGSKMIVWSGYDADGGYLKTGGVFIPCAPANTNSWTSTTTTGAPSGRWVHTAVWTGSKMIIWGGDNGPSFLNTGGQFDPVANSWTATTTTGAPTGRSGHAAVWTGSKMIVWGGSDDNTQTYFNVGGQYDPVANSWTATTTVGAPTARDIPGAIWTGSKMIIWGGRDVSSQPTSGGQYDPVTNKWTTTSTAGAPTGRTMYTMVWTGSKMIVWGGYGSSYLNTGGQYDPSTNSWTATTTTGAPSARIVHTAVWTGSKMIVWGGSTGGAGSNFNTGGQYDPLTNSWIATTTTGVPAARRMHTAVWTGSKMIIWGGAVTSSINSGGEYDASANTWSVTSLVNAPEARHSHSSIWTGSQMIVWGGNNNRLNTGGVYTP